jgi:hypothetical protein
MVVVVGFLRQALHHLPLGNFSPCGWLALEDLSGSPRPFCPGRPGLVVPQHGGKATLMQARAVPPLIGPGDGRQLGGGFILDCDEGRSILRTLVESQAA